jgi:FMN phosphatase YigB (HAD superfamily)
LIYAQRLAKSGLKIGIRKVQDSKLKNSGLDQFVDFIVCSESCGFQKPDPRFFEHALKLASHTSKDDVLVVGDKIDVDVKGALQSGLRSCWFNPHGLANPVDYSPHHEIKSLKELCRLS